MTQPKPVRFKRRWTDLEDAQLRSLYANTPSPAIATLMMRGKGSIAQRAMLLGLSKSPEYMRAHREAQAQHLRTHPTSVANRFKPDQTPWNKGASYQPGGRCAQTQFKPGTLPAKTLPIGSFRVTKGVLMIKYADGLKGPKSARWKSYQRHIWEAAHGPVPAGHRVIFKPGYYRTQPDDVRLDRLEMISYRDQMIRNSYWRNQPPELATLTQLKGAITRQVNRIAREHAARKPETPTP